MPSNETPTVRREMKKAERALPSEEDRILTFRTVMAISSANVEKAKHDESASDNLEQNDVGDGRGLSLAFRENLERLVSSSLLIPVETNADASFDPCRPTEDDSAFECVVMLLSNVILLLGDEGYDARVRHVLKTACVHLLCGYCDRGEGHIHEDSPAIRDVTEREGGGIGETVADEVTPSDRDERIFSIAAKKFEAIERAIADGMMRVLSKEAAGEKEDDVPGKTTRGKFMRGLQIGTVGAVAGTLFAVTGGLAAPGIAAGLAALGVVGGSATAAITLLTTTSTLATLFGLGGGGMAAYKMKRRTDGLSEFRIRKERVREELGDDREGGDLHSTVCVSGWLHDTCDFQRPWGVSPTDPPISSWLERLRRFYAVYSPDEVDSCEDILEKFRGKEDSLCAILKEKYGRDPNHLLPLDGTEKRLSLEENAWIAGMLSDVVLTKRYASDLQNMQRRNSSRKIRAISAEGTQLNITKTLPFHRHQQPSTNPNPHPKTDRSVAVWDWTSSHTGDLYTVTWESQQLLPFCNLVRAILADLSKKGTQEILKTTALATLISAVAWPTLLMKAADTIDDPYQMIILRSDEAGVELARGLLKERRPVTLVGYSFGARVVFSCLLELARCQVAWEEGRSKTNHTGVSPPLTDDAREPASVVEDVVLMGMPRYIDRDAWSLCRRVVAGRMINCYSRGDWFLSLMFRYNNVSGILRNTCGTRPVEGVSGVENYDVSSLVSTHGNYCVVVPDILEVVRFGQPNPLILSVPVK